MNAADWFKGRRVLVTGHTGFKGTWLAAWLRDAGAEVTGFALPPEPGRPSLFEMAHVHEGMRSITGDMRDPVAVNTMLGESRPEIVLHLAAQSLVRRSYVEPIETFSTNVMGTANLLEALRGQDSVEAVVVVTSDKCYENLGLERGYVEGDPLGGHDPYSASKGCQEIVTASYSRSFLAEQGVPVATARAGNVVGGGDWSEDRLMVDLMVAAGANQTAVIRNPEAVRPWQFMLEPLRGYLMLAQALVERGPEVAEAWNFGPAHEDAVPVRRVVELVADAWPRVTVEMAPPGPAPHEAHLLRLDNRKASEKLGWTPVLTLEETIRNTVTWYRDISENPGEGSELMTTQLADYSRRVADASPTMQST